MDAISDIGNVSHVVQLAVALGNFFQFGIAIPIALLFITAMLLIVVALFIFLKEILIAKANLRIGPH